jgi:hypothetical protein
MVKTNDNALQHAKSKFLHEGLLKPNLTETQEEISSFISDWSGTTMPQLYDVESSYSEPERSLPLDLGLDQIEDC